MRLAVPWLCLCVVLNGATGVAVPQLSAFDAFMNGLLAKWQIPGAALGVSHNGRLMLARGYGMADSRVKDGQPVQPDSLFRIAGISKTITAAAILRLVEDGKLRLDDKVRDLLQHASDDGYASLGRMIEKASGQSYEGYVKSAVLMPLGISGMRIDAAGGWMASVSDLLRFANALDGRRPPMFLKPTSLQVVEPAGINGAGAYIFRQAATGVDVALLFNSRPSGGGAFEADVSAGLVRTANSIVNWPPHDLFASGPELFARDVVNAADHRGGGVAPGEIVDLFPSNAGPPNIAEWPLTSRRTTPIGATRVFFDNIAARVLYSVSGQVRAIVPYEVSTRKATEVVVEYQGVRSPPVTLPVVGSAPALFTLDASGKGQAAMLNETGCCNSVRNPATRGTVAALYGTGEGRLPSGGNVPSPVKVTVGGAQAEVLYAGNIGGLQVNFRVPANAPAGDAVPLVVTVGDARSSDGVTMAVRSSSRRILVVGHEPAIRSRLARILTGAGYEVVTVQDGREAGARAKEQPVDLVISDLAMPEEEGLEMIHAMRNESPQLKIMVMAGAFDPDVLRAADMLGAQAVLSKPMAAEVVLRRVRGLLRERTARY